MALRPALVSREIGAHGKQRAFPGTRGLPSRRYTFEVRATGPGGADPTAARKSFTVAPRATASG